MYTTSEGDVLLTLKDNTVWVSEGFDLALARQLRDKVEQANLPPGEGPTMQARSLPTDHDLVGGLVDTFSRYGVMKEPIR